MEPSITLNFDIISPFSYIAFHILKNSPVFSKCQVNFVPVALRDLFQKCENSPPITVKNKMQWINSERLYWARRFDVPMSEAIPQGFPTPTKDLQTALALIHRDFPDKLFAVSQKIYHTFWADCDTSIAKPENFLAVIKNEMGEEAVTHIENLLATPEAKELMLEKTQYIFDSGAFGLPWFECVNAAGVKEGFWGIDHLGRVADFLELDVSQDKAFRVLL